MRRRELLLFLATTVLFTAGCSDSADQSASSPPESAGKPTATGGARLLAPDEFADAVADGDRFLLNVHTPDEGSIPGTDAAIPFDQVEARAADLPKDPGAPLAVYCRSGSMSAVAVETLGELGYRDVVELRGGMIAWEGSGRTLLPSRATALGPTGSRSPAQA